MTRSLSIAQLKAHLSEVVGEVHHTGAEIVIEKHGKPVARLVPIEAANRPEGLLALVGAFEDAPEFPRLLEEIVRSRRKDKARRVPKLK